MKSLRINSYKDGQGKVMNNNNSVRKKNVSFDDRPTPLDFDLFIPWFCLELQVPKNIVVTRTNQAEYIQYGSKSSKDGTKKSSKLKSRSIKSKLSKSEYEDKHVSREPRVSFATSTIDFKDAIPITTYYDKRGRLVQIEIVGCSFPIHRKVIQAFNLCLPFHSGLSKLSIRNGGLNQVILYEIGKLLPHSNITEICLDDSCIPLLNYSILLDRPSQIKYLSLKRCGINDEECKKIAMNIDLYGPAVKTLLLLDLTSNNISDKGAQALGEALKTNRYLLHLNLSGNNISDIGAAFIFKYLQEFPLSLYEIKEKWRRRFHFLKSRAIVYKKCLGEAELADAANKSKKADLCSDIQLITGSNPKQSRQQRIIKKNIPSFIIEETSVQDAAEKKTKEIMGDFEHPFKDEFITRQNDVVSAVGNFILTSLNLAYNNLTLLSIRKLLEVLKYQCAINKPSQTTALLRVVIDGNNIPTRCVELDEIDICLKKAVSENELNMSFLRLTNSATMSGKII